ncbi:PIN domain-containing protein [Lentzea sp. NBRC 105346]|uniref:PIN domain-containing protein n=1 Tax=Lentzea sp. NBRC 105346 TaxID=3032205 RepID=UPI0024A221A9|nr:PIN domain-containing protein [Lentzea sp. NBRC 105346]GLZ35873.1 PIN domain-containing protein [Lentzea sp. NBRC 105346]
MSFVVVYDANVLYPSTLRDLLLRIGASGLVQAKWTNQILDEVFDNLRTNRPDLPREALSRTRSLMMTAVRDCLVTGYEPLIPVLELPDPDDRHVLAAAIKARAQVIVTNNRKDFPTDALRQWDIDPKDADEFVLDQIGLDAKVVWSCVQQIANSWRTPPGTIGDVLASLERSGLVQSVAELRAR